MALAVMTNKWRGYADDILVFIIRKRKANEEAFLSLSESAMDIFNLWANERGTAIDDVELALWCLNFIKDLMRMPFKLLVRAAEIDGLCY